MPKISAFRGLRYNLAQVGSLSSVVAPPYDVIDAQLRNELLQKSPYNFVRLELPQPENNGDQDAMYSRASTLLRQWTRDGLLQHEPDPAIYVYHQQFDFDGRTYTRRGFMARLRLERFGEGKIYPHEQTHAKAKDDRLKLTRACRANLSQIFGLYPDQNNAAQQKLENYVAGRPSLECEDHLGVIHRIWPVTNQDLIAEVALQVEDSPLFIADGHHRYETACNYRDELAQSNDDGLAPDHPAQFVLAMLMSMDDPGLVVLPTHRLFSGIIDFDASELVARLSSGFDCEPMGHGAERARVIWQQIQELNDQGVLGLYTSKDDAWTLVTTNEHTPARMREVAPEHSEEWRGLGVSMLHALIMDRLLDQASHEKPTYVHLVREVVDGLRGRLEGAKTYPLAALVMPAKVQDVRQISLNGERMPAKSTYFYPKLLSGLVVNPLDEN